MSALKYFVKREALRALSWPNYLGVWLGRNEGWSGESDTGRTKHRPELQTPVAEALQPVQACALSDGPGEFLILADGTSLNTTKHPFLSLKGRWRSACASLIVDRRRLVLITQWSQSLKTTVGVLLFPVPIVML